MVPKPKPEQSTSMEEQELFNQVFTRNPDAIVIVRRSDAVVLAVNPAFTALTGYEERELVGKTTIETGFWENMKSRKETMNSVITQGNLYYRTRKILCKDGSNIFIAYTTIALNYKNQDCYMSTIRNVNETVRLEQELRESEGMFRVLSEQSLLGISILQDDVFKYANQAFCDILGFTREEILNWKPGEYVKQLHDGDRDLAYERGRKKQAGHTDVIEHYSYRILKKDGTTRWVDQFSRTINFRGKSADLVTFVDITEIKKTEESLRRSETMYRLLAENSYDIIWTSDLRGKYTYISPSLPRVLGYQDLDEKSLTLKRILHPASFARARKATIQVYRGFTKARKMESRTFEVEAFHKNGNTIWIEVTITALMDDDGNLLGLRGSGRDIHEKKLAEIALKRSEERNRAMLQALPDLIFRIDRNGVYLDYHANVPSELAIFPSEFIGTRITDHEFSKAFSSELLAMIQESLDQQRVCTMDYQLKLDQTKYHYEARISPCGENDVILIIRNITSRTQAQELVKESEQRYRTLFERSPIGVLQIDVDGHILNANPKLIEILHSPSLEATRQINVLTYPPLVEAGLNTAVKRCLKTGESFVTEHEYTSKWGLTGYFRVHLAPVLNDRNLVIGAQLLVEDFTQSKIAEQERIALEKQVLETQNLESISVLAGGIAHDFNNLLAGIMGNADLAMMAIPKESKARDSIEKILASAERAAELTNQMLAYSGKGQFIIQSVNLTDIVEDIAQLVRVSISRKANLNLRLDHNLEAIRADATQLRQIVMNLIINASDALGDNIGNIFVETGMTQLTINELGDMLVSDEFNEGRFVFIRVADTGHGMSEDTLSKIFNPFFTTKFTGRGLGLSATLGIVRSHGGAIRVNSKINEGTEFLLYFPSSGTEKIHTTIASHGGLVTGSGTILVVDDEESVREFVREVLEMVGYDTILAENGSDALQKFQEHKHEIDLILLDLVMPKLSGEEVFKQLEKAGNTIPVVFSSGFSKKDALNAFKDRPVSGYIAKPYRASKLTRVISDILRRYDS